MKDTLKRDKSGSICDSNASNNNFGVKELIEELNYFWGFQTKIESKLFNLESLHSRKDGIIEFLLVQLVLHNESKFETSNDSDTESKSSQKTIKTATTNFFQQFS